VLADFSRPVAIAFAKVWQACGVAGILGRAFLATGRVGDGFAVRRLLNGGGLRAGVIDQDDAPEMGARLKRCELGFEGCKFTAELRETLFILHRVFRAHRALAVLNALKHRDHRIIVLLRDGVELVIVAACAVHGETEKGGGRCADHVVQFVGALIGGEHRVFGPNAIFASAD
jgi:hypothetical protein